MASAKRNYAAGRYQAAAAEFAKAATVAKRNKDRDEALFMQARMLRRAGLPARAQAIYRNILALSTDGPRSGRAQFELAKLEVAHGNKAKGYTLLQEAIEKHPSHGASRGAFRQLVEHLDSSDRTALRTLLKRWTSALKGSDSEQRARYELAQLEGRDGNTELALSLLLKAAKEHPYPKGNLTDDALWHASLFAEKLNRYQQAVAILEQLLSTREVAQGGSYERPRFPAAQYRIAELWRDPLNNPAQARGAFRKVHQIHSTSILADDALWNEGLLALRLGDPKGACDAAERFRQAFPDSRYRRCLKQLCPQFADTEKGCPDYILRAAKQGRSPSPVQATDD